MLRKYPDLPSSFPVPESSHHPAYLGFCISQFLLANLLQAHHQPKNLSILLTKSIHFPLILAINMNRTTSNPNPDSFHTMLKESIDRFFIEYRKGSTDFSNFTCIFSRLLQNLPDPPLEIVWFYAALTFRTTEFTAGNSSNQVLLAKDLFQLLVSCSSSCNAVKKIAVLAPVIYELHSAVSEGKNLTKEIESLVEVIVSYISICSGSNFCENEEFRALDYCFMDLIRVWVVEKLGESCKLGEELRVFFPLVCDGILEGITDCEGCEVGYLAGIVMSHTFLLRLCLKFRLGISRAELETELRGSAIQTVTAFRSYHFIGENWLLLFCYCHRISNFLV